MKKNNINKNTSEKLNTWKYVPGNNAFTQENMEIIFEQSVDLVLNGTHLLSFFCSPIDLKALAIGFLWNENIIYSLDDILNLTMRSNHSQINVSVASSNNQQQSLMRTSSGITISRDSEIIHEKRPFKINPETLIQLYEEFSSQQKLHKTAGGYHSAALSDGKMVNIIVEDLGRHNCLDKISGKFLLEGKPFTPQLILLSGRISSEMINKALRLEAPLIVTRTTPTVQAVEIANSNGITIIGYLRANQFSVFTHPERILFQH
ncbi:MAG: formate dehydrogenase accessory sulfurtransferase FdhD [Chloroflexi bacterium]|jgi:FdhD protein|nr:formate dehydrogenase accessory sulfurtransferase FdhD [Chloroflexota bacterium]